MDTGARYAGTNVQGKRVTIHLSAIVQSTCTQI